MSCSAVAEELAPGGLFAVIPEYSMKIGCGKSNPFLVSVQTPQPGETSSSGET